jgi:hypothetical protein
MGRDRGTEADAEYRSSREEGQRGKGEEGKRGRGTEAEAEM